MAAGATTAVRGLASKVFSNTIQNITRSGEHFSIIFLRISKFIICVLIIYMNLIYCNRLCGEDFFHGTAPLTFEFQNISFYFII